VHHEPNQLAQHLGLRVKDKQGLHIHQVLRGGAAENAGFASGDEWLAVHATSDTSGTPWRITSLDDIAVYCGNADRLQALICRDKRLHTLTLTLPPPSTALRLSVRDAATADRWLQGLPLLLPTSTPV
jgi:predicted metalloprotease with PDZ domain